MYIRYRVVLDGVPFADHSGKPIEGDAAMPTKPTSVTLDTFMGPVAKLMLETDLHFTVAVSLFEGENTGISINSLCNPTIIADSTQLKELGDKFVTRINEMVGELLKLCKFSGELWLVKREAFNRDYAVMHVGIQVDCPVWTEETYRFFGDVPLLKDLDMAYYAARIYEH